MQDLIDYIQKHSQQLHPIPSGEKFRILHNKNSLKCPKTILFDIYGTLLISASGDISLAEKQSTKNDALQKLAHLFHCKIPGYELPALFFKEVKIEHKRLQTKGIVFPEVRVEELWARILQKNPAKDRDFIEAFALGYELAVNPVFPMPGLSRVLTSIKSKSIPMGIISNAQFFTPLLFPAFLGKSLENLGFEKKLCFYSFEFRQGKPDTNMYEKSAEALKAMGISPEHCLFIGNDMLNDILPADSTGYQTALFAGDKRSLRWRQDVPACKAIQPDFVLSSLEDIEVLITGGNYELA